MSNAQVAATAATAPNLLQRALAKGFNVGIQKFRDFLATLRETAVKEQEVAISQAILIILFLPMRRSYSACVPIQNQEIPFSTSIPTARYSLLIRVRPRLDNPLLRKHSDFR